MRALITRFVRQLASKLVRSPGLPGECECGVSPQDCRDRKIWQECGVVPPGAACAPPSVAGYEVRYEP